MTHHVLVPVRVAVAVAVVGRLAAQYFGGAGGAVPLWLLAAWSCVGILVLLTRTRGRALEQAA